MPLLNPGIVLSSAYLSDDITITQRDDTIGDDGESVLTPKSRLSYAIVTAASMKDLERLPEAQRSERIMSFLVPESVRAAAANVQADIITWQSNITGASNDFLVVNVAPYPNYGQGWYQVLAETQDIIDATL